MPKSKSRKSRNTKSKSTKSKSNSKSNSKSHSKSSSKSSSKSNSKRMIDCENNLPFKSILGYILTPQPEPTIKIDDKQLLNYIESLVHKFNRVQKPGHVKISFEKLVDFIEHAYPKELVMNDEIFGGGPENALVLREKKPNDTSLVSTIYKRSYNAVFLLAVVTFIFGLIMLYNCYGEFKQMFRKRDNLAADLLLIPREEFPDGYATFLNDNAGVDYLTFIKNIFTECTDTTKMLNLVRQIGNARFTKNLEDTTKDVLNNCGYIDAKDYAPVTDQDYSFAAYSEYLFKFAKVSYKTITQTGRDDGVKCSNKVTANNAHLALVAVETLLKNFEAGIESSMSDMKGSLDFAIIILKVSGTFIIGFIGAGLKTTTLDDSKSNMALAGLQKSQLVTLLTMYKLKDSKYNHQRQAAIVQYWRDNDIDPTKDRYTKELLASIR